MQRWAKADLSCTLTGENACDDDYSRMDGRKKNIKTVDKKNKGQIGRNAKCTKK